MLESKICGLTTAEAVAATVAGGARWAGFVFYPPSPRAVSPEQAAALAAGLGPDVGRVALLVDPDDTLLDRVLAALRPDLIQLHGSESPARVAAIRERSARPVMKAIKVARPDDLAVVEGYLPVADRLLFDAKAPATLKDALPGGNALSFDWRILAGRSWPRPWMLSGGLGAENLEEAVRISGARAVDVSSAVESTRGVKDPQKVRAFLDRARTL